MRSRGTRWKLFPGITFQVLKKQHQVSIKCTRIYCLKIRFLCSLNPCYERDDLRKWMLAILPPTDAKDRISDIHIWDNIGLSISQMNDWLTAHIIQLTYGSCQTQRPRRAVYQIEKAGSRGQNNKKGEYSVGGWWSRQDYLHPQYWCWAARKT